MYSEKYIESALPFLLYLLIIPSRTLLQGAMAAVGKGKILLRNSVISLVLNGCLTFVLVNQFGYFGAIIATIIVLYCWDVMISLKELSSSLKCKMTELYPKKVFTKLALCSMLSSAPIYPLLFLINKENAFLQLVVVALIYFPLYLLLGIKLKLFSEEMLSFINQNYDKIKLKLRPIFGSSKW
jgi:O-antigen/teichoic acid export membrane protein